MAPPVGPGPTRLKELRELDPTLELLLVDAVRLLPEMTMYSTRPSMTTILRVVKA